MRDAAASCSISESQDPWREGHFLPARRFLCVRFAVAALHMLSSAHLAPPAVAYFELLLLLVLGCTLIHN